MIKVQKSPKGGFRLYPTNEMRERAFQELKSNGWNYFVFFRDANPNNQFGLNYAKVDWLEEGKLYISR